MALMVKKERKEETVSRLGVSDSLHQKSKMCSCNKWDTLKGQKNYLKGIFW